MIRILISVLFMACTSFSAFSIESARIDAASGAPRLLIDGKPTRMRIFYGAPGTRPLHIDPTGQTVSFEFSPTEDAPGQATMHFRFGQLPGDIFLDDIQVVDLDGGDVLPRCDFENGAESLAREWNSWPPPEKNTIAKLGVQEKAGRENSRGVKISIKAPADGVWPDFHFYHHPNLSLRKGHRYKASLWARAVPARDLGIVFYRPGANYVDLGGPENVFEMQIKLAAAAGVDIVSFPVAVPWPNPGEADDWSAADSVCQRVLNANPHGLLLPRLSIEAPAWWLNAHPGHAMMWDDGKAQVEAAAVASPEYKIDAAARLAAMVTHLEAKFGAQIIGYHPTGQNTGEWFYQNSWGAGFSGYSKIEAQVWQDWLKVRYHDNASLGNAWHDIKTTFSNAPVPTAQMRRESRGALRNPRNEKQVIDFAEFQQEMMADCVCTLAKAAKQACKGRKLVLFFYGYLFELAGVPSGPSTTGHYALRQVLNSPDIDVLCAPISYFDRGLGESAPSMSVSESVTLAGKMWLQEDDTHTQLSSGDYPGCEVRVDTSEKSQQELLRNTGQCAVRNFGTWWMDLGATGWFNDAALWAQMKKLEPIDQYFLEHPTPFKPQIALVVDPKSMMRIAPKVNLGIYNARKPLGRMGAPYGQYLLDDVAAARVDAKVYVFLAAWCMQSEQRRQLLAATRNGVNVWCYAPGYQDDAAVSLDGMSELTGFQMKQIGNVRAWAAPTKAGEKLGLHEPFGTKEMIDPLFTASDATPDETLATFSDGSAAVALRRTATGASLFVGAPALSSEIMRLAARLGSAHLFTQVDCNIYANGPYVILHGAQDGALDFDSGQDVEIVDGITQISLGRRKISLPMKKGETRILFLKAQ